MFSRNTLNKYLGEMYFKGKEDAYYEIKKGPMSKDEYELNFMEPDKYSHVLNEKSIVGQFIERLGDHIKHKVKTFLPNTFNEAMQENCLCRAKVRRRKYLSVNLNLRINEQKTLLRKFD